MQKQAKTGKNNDRYLGTVLYGTIFNFFFFKRELLTQICTLPVRMLR